MSDEKPDVFEKLSKLTNVHKLLICIGTYVLLILAFVFGSYKSKFEEIKTLDKKLADVSAELKKITAKAKKLEALKKKYQEAQKEFNVAKQALPDGKQIPELLASVTKAGLVSGLQFKLFKPGRDAPQGFYAAIPVSIQVTGGYQNFIQFCDKVSRLPRIVHIKNVSMGATNKKTGADITTKCSAVTYKFLEAK